jgi:ribosome-binding ATPase
MRIVIVGAPQAGQQQLYSLLTGASLSDIQQKPLEVHIGVCEVKDPRVTKLKEMYNPKKTTYAKIEFLLLPDFNLQGPAKTAIITQLKNADELCLVARSEAEIDSIMSELVISDMMLVEKRIENIKKEQKRKSSPQMDKEKALMERCLAQLEQELPIRQMDASEEDKKQLRTYQFLSMKPIILVINVSEDKINDLSLMEEISRELSLPAVQISAEIEQEISNLDQADRVEFMKEMGITESALDKMTTLAFSGLGLISFFTVGEDEVRAWSVRKGSSAPVAGSVIHSDIQKGFVRAEMCKYTELISAGSEAKLKETGKFHLKGKDYIVEDADILSFRFNV